MLSIVEFAIHRRDPEVERMFPEDPDDKDHFEKDGLKFYVMGAVGHMNNEIEMSGWAMFKDLFEGVDISNFWQENDHSIEQTVYCVFDVVWSKDHEGKWDCDIEYIGRTDPNKWTAQTLEVGR